MSWFFTSGKLGKEYLGIGYICTRKWLTDNALAYQSKKQGASKQLSQAHQSKQTRWQTCSVKAMKTYWCGNVWRLVKKSVLCKISRESGWLCGNEQKSGYITAIMINRRDFQKSGVLMDDERSCVQIRPEHVQTSPNPSKYWRKVAKGWSFLGGGNVNEHDIHHYNALWGCCGWWMGIS